MKTLFVLRHAKSSWDDINLSDFDRPLNKRGLETAPRMGEMMYQQDFLPKLIVSSPAKRAKQTAVLIKETAQISGEIKFDEKIYEASPFRLLQIISKFDEKFDSAMIIGHNPGFEGLVQMLTGKLRAMPTAALAIIDLNIEKWSDISAESGTLRKLICPKDDLKSLGVI